MGGKKSTRRNIEQAYELKVAKQRYFRLSLASLCGAMVCVIVYSFLSVQGFFNASDATIGFTINALFMVLAGVVGVLSYKWTKASRAFKEFISNNGLSEQDI